MARLRTAGRWVLLGVATLLVLGLLFVNVGPRFLPYQALAVRSGSMSPAIPTGALVLYERATASQLRVGDIIVFDKPGDPSEKVTHRIHAIGNGPQGRYFITKGDANSVPDAWTVSATGTGWKAFWHVAGVGYFFGFFQSSNLRFLLIAIPAALLAALALLDFRRSRRTTAVVGAGPNDQPRPDLQSRSPWSRIEQPKPPGSEGS